MLLEKLDAYLENDIYSFSMPAHKRNTNILNKKLPYDRDITEIRGFDNLNDPKTIFASMENKLKDIYKAKDFIISTNGSTCGILASIRTLTYANKKILIQRNSHKSVYNALELFKLDYDFIDLKFKNDIAYDLDYDDLKDKLSKNTYQAIVLTSPTYEGYMVDLKKIKKFSKDIPIILDMAHGSHLVLDTYYDGFDFDLAITSFHKNLSALTPASGIIVKGKDIDARELRRNMAIFQTSSPSYVLCQSIDDMIENFNIFPKMYANLKENLKDLYEIKLNKIKFINDLNKDFSKIIISCKNTNIGGDFLSEQLYKEKIEIEMAHSTYLILISSIFDTKKGFDRLANALLKVDKNLFYKKNNFNFSYKIPKKILPLSKAIYMKTSMLDLDKSKGRISGDFIYAYPPGIPLIVPGEIFDEDIILNIKNLLSNSINLNIENERVKVLD